MQIKFSMPEILVIFSLVMYDQSFTFSTIAFCLGVIARLLDYVMQYSIDLKKAESINQSVDELGTAFKGIFGDLDKK